MKCPKCGSENVTVQMVSETHLKEKKHGVLWWLCIGWYWVPIKWVIFTLPALILAIFKPKKYKSEVVNRKMAVCQTCGHSWEIK